MVDLNGFRVGITAGLICGSLIGGIGARLAMRGVALFSGLSPDFSVEGTLGILVMGAVAGAVLGLVYAVVRRFLPVAEIWRGLIFGMIFAGLTALPFLDPEGELALASPLVGASLFVPIPILFGLGLGLATPWLERRYTRHGARPVAVAWVAAFGAALIFGFVRIASVVESSRVPPAILGMVERLGVPFHSVRDAQSMIGLLFLLSFCTLCVLIFWLGSASRPAKLAAIALLVFGGLFFGGASLLLRLEISLQAEWGALLFVAALWLAAMALQWRRMRHASDPGDHREQAWLMLVLATWGVTFLAMWAGILLTPRLQLRGMAGVTAALTVAPFLWPWLLVPLTLVWAIWRGGIWSVRETAAEPAV